MCSANGPNFARAFIRSLAWVRTAATSSGECPALRSSVFSFRDSDSRYGPREFSSAHPSGVRTWAREVSGMGISLVFESAGR